MIKFLKKYRRYLLTALLTLIILDQILSWSYLSFIRKELNAQHIPKKADIGFVLFGPYNSNEDRFRPQTLLRMEKTLELYNNKAISQIHCVGGWKSYDPSFGSKKMTNWLLKNAIPEANIHTGYSSYDTQSNCRQISALLKSQPDTTGYLITTELHCYRTLKMVNAPKIYGIPCRYPERGIQKWAKLYRDIHYEWIAWTALCVLPQSTYETGVKRYRNRNNPE